MKHILHSKNNSKNTVLFLAVFLSLGLFASSSLAISETGAQDSGVMPSSSNGNSQDTKSASQKSGSQSSGAKNTFSASPGVAGSSGKNNAETKAPPPTKATAAQRAVVERLDPLARSAFWSREVSIDPSDAEAGIKLAAALRQLGRFDQADEAASKVLLLQPEYYDALLEAARIRILAKKAFYAIPLLQKAEKIAPKDSEPLTLMALALDQTKRYDEAFAAHRAALNLAPNNPAVLSNFAMFYAVRGDKVEAERLLRQAVAQPTATIQERQNLALILGLEGRLAEAETLIRQDLPPELADSNLAYLKSLQGKPLGSDMTIGRTPIP